MLLLERIFAFLQTAFDFAVFIADLLDFATELLALVEDLILGPQFRLLASVFGVFFGLANDRFGPSFCIIEVQAILAANQSVRAYAADCQAQEKGQEAPEQFRHGGHSLVSGMLFDALR